MAITASSPELSAAIERAARHLSYLQQRWRDEREYEDWREYVTSMRSNLPSGATNVRMTQRPFAVSWDQTGEPRRTLRVRRNSVECSYLEPAAKA
jgi:hypothetical protein